VLPRDFIHNIGGLSDWIRGVGDQLARDGFIAVVAGGVREGSESRPLTACG
jgi:dienelactone hydrolase